MNTFGPTAPAHHFLPRALRPKALRDAAYPAFMLALALGAILALFGLFNATVLRPLPVAGQERLVCLDFALLQGFPGPLELGGLSPAQAREAGDLQGTLEALVQADLRPLRVESQGFTQSLFVGYTSPNYFTALGIPCAAGRPYTTGDPEPGAVLSHAFWKAQAGRLGPGSRLKVDGVDLPVLGVAPEGFQGLDVSVAPALWVPIEARIRSGPREARLLSSTSSVGLPTYGRLRPGATCAQAHSALMALVPGWVAAQKGTDDSLRVQARVSPLRVARLQVWNYAMPMASVLWAGLAALLAMALLNLGSLQVARWMTAREELTTRSALGASPGRLALEMGAPVLLPLALGLLGALPLAHFGGQVMAGFAPPSEYPVALYPSVDLRVLGVAVLVILVFFALLGLFAWLWILRRPLHAAGRSGLEAGGERSRKLLVGLQVALSTLLLVGTLSSLREIRRAADVPMGFDLRGVRAYSFAMPTHVPTRADFIHRWSQLCDHFQRLPGLEAASVAIPPCEAYGYDRETFRTGADRSLSMRRNHVHPGTFRLLGIPILEGRDFRPEETPDGQKVAILERRTAERLWPGVPPLGATLLDPQGRPHVVVGVVADHRWNGPLSPEPPMVFMSARQRTSPLQTLLVKGGPRDLDTWVEQEIARVDPRLAVSRRDLLTERLARKLQPQRLAATLFGMLGLSALVLCLGGLYALQRHVTLQRMPELGLRTALGATPARLITHLLMGLAWPLGCGLAAGLLGTWGLWRILAARWSELPPLTPGAVLTVALGLLATALATALLPSLRALRLDPSELLRRE